MTLRIVSSSACILVNTGNSSATSVLSKSTMNYRVRTILFILLLAISVLSLPALLEGNIIDELPEEADRENDDLTIISDAVIPWLQAPVHLATILLQVGISFFVLFVVYLGGRSKHRRFNDRTIDPAQVFRFNILKTALSRAVFNFLFFGLFHTSHPLIRVLNPILISPRRSKRL